ncbi:MAG TPA: PilZ domain-containing protein [Allosphingosinicella sp.]|nr:PilZ domain-containing protein [Allosphingosinicella sp.]
MQAFSDLSGGNGVHASEVIAAGNRLRTQADEAGAEAPERRRGRRIRTVFRIARVARDHVVSLWRVRNISDFGMALLTHAKPALGERLTVMLSDHVTVDAHVVWANGEGCGIAFEAPIDSAATLTALVQEQREPHYRPPRIEAHIPACIDGENGVHPVIVSDVSQHGIGFRHAASLEPGLRVRVQFDTGVERRGIVRWVQAQRAGVELFDPLSCEELETILAA